MASGLTEADLDELEDTPRELAFTLEQERGRAVVIPDEKARKALLAVPRLVAEVRRLRGRVENMEVEETRREKEARRGKPAEKEKPARAPAEPAEDLASLLAAPFRVSPRTAAAAKDDPLAALAVQVARSMWDDASDVERARLIAMAFAAAEGNMDAFWQARRQRSLAKLGALAK